jgi:hypothetical protein
MALSESSIDSSRAASRELAAYRAELNAWLDAHAEGLAPRYVAPGTLDEHVAQMQRVKAILFEARVSIARLLDRMTGPAGARRYEYAPTYILRGLQKVHLDYTPVA